MAGKTSPTPDDENLKALEHLSSVQRDPFPPVRGTPAKPPSAAPPPPPPPPPPGSKPPAAQPAAQKPSTLPYQVAPGGLGGKAPQPAAPAKPAAPAQPAGSPVSRPAAKRESDVDEHAPKYRCLRCGYPINEAGDLRCTECGRAYDTETLEWWFSGEEEQRFNRVIWLTLAVLFGKLLLIPDLMSLGRFSGAVATAIACSVAMNGKRGTVGGYCAVSGLVVAVLMGLGFAWSISYAIPFYTLDIVAACLLVLAMLHDPVGGRVGGLTLARQAAPVIIFAAPLWGWACWWAANYVGNGVTGPFASWGDYGPFSFMLPYLAAAGVWVFAWLTLVSVRKTMFGVREDD